MFSLILNEQAFPVIEQITAGMPGGFFIYHADQNEKLIYANIALIRMFGCESLDDFKEYTGYTFRGMVHPEDFEMVEQSIRHQISEKDLDFVEYRIVRKDGEIRWMEDYGHFVHTNKYGDIFYVFLEDATEKYLKKQKDEEAKILMQEKLGALEKLAHETTSLNIVHEMLGSGKWSMEFNEQGKMIRVLWSKQFRRMIGYHDETDFPNTLEAWSNLLHEEDKERVLKEYYDTIHDYTGQKKYDVEYRLLTKTGGYHWYRATGMLSRRKDGSPITYVGMFVDITAQKQLDQELIQKQKQLEEALEKAQRSDQAKTVFLNNMSHDIRTPMNAIIGFSNLALLHMENRDQVREYLSKIVVSSNHLLELINDVLDMSHIESGKLQIQEQDCNILEILRDLQTIVQADVQAKELEFSIDTVNLEHEVVLCDKLRLTRVLLNIVSNALKFTPKRGCIHVCVTEKGERQEQYVSYEIRVRDTGIGMSREFLAHIFEPFERERTSTVSGIQGTGLGMPITKNIVNMMNGTITIDSEQGKGTEVTLCFLFRVPQCICEPDCKPEKNEAEVSFCGKRILLTEDNELNQEIAMTILEEAGFEVDVAENGAVAVEKMKNSAPGTYDVILMDIQMPVMDGYEATAAIRSLENQALAQTPIIAITANAFVEDKRRAIDAGMNGHLGKPIEIDKLITALQNIFAGSCEKQNDYRC